jgi:hypothetical protein
MKRIFLSLCVSAFIFIPKKDHAQSAGPADNNENRTIYYYNYAKNFITSNVPLNELSTRAYRHFEKNYSGVDKETWTKVFNGTLVTFISNGAFYKIFYSKPGEFVYSYKYYGEKNCAPEITKTVARFYPEYKIVSVAELFDGLKLVYGINISDGKTTKNLEMKNNELTVIDEFRNQ